MMEIRSHGVGVSDFDDPRIDVEGWGGLDSVSFNNDLLILDLDFSKHATSDADVYTVNSLWDFRREVEGFFRSDGTIIVLVDETLNLKGENAHGSYGIHTYNLFSEIGVKINIGNLRRYECQPIVQNEALEEYLKVAKDTETHVGYHTSDFDEVTELARRGEQGKPCGVALESIDGTGNGSLIILPRPHNISSRPEQWLDLLIRSCLPYFPNHLQEELMPDSSPDETPKDSKSAQRKVVYLCERFPKVAEKLTDRYNDRTPLEMEDEHDVQDLFHALLKIHFDDIRDEEQSPSHAGSSSRVDFILKEEDLGVEIKYAKNHTRRKKLKKQLAEDKEQYGQHPNCDKLICFIYDPEQVLGNPRGFEKDMTGKTNGLDTKVIIKPK